MAFKVIIHKNLGVQFAIDHQKFTLLVLDDPEQPKMDRYKWYARQLRIALRRLQKGG